MEFEYLQGRPNFIKLLTKADVDDRLTVTSEMASMMPPAEPGRDIPIRVLDDQGDNYQFCLAGRRGQYLKPYFKPKDWRAFMRRRGGKAGDSLYFWPEVSERECAEYRIEVIPFIIGVSPHSEGTLGSSNLPSPGSPEALRTWAAQGLTLYNSSFVANY